MAILGARAWECGNSMLNTVDANIAVASATEAHTGTYSLRLSTGAPATGWARWAIAGTPLNPSVSVWVNLDTMFDSSNTSYIQFVLDPSGLLVELRWNHNTHTYDCLLYTSPSPRDRS